MRLTILAETLTILKLPAGASLPPEAANGTFFSMTRAAEETSIVCASEVADRFGSGPMEAGWRALRVEGPLDFALTGILAGIAAPLAAAGISIFAVSTFDTDYILVKEEMLSKAVTVLREAGYELP